jgi:hypothetical protein
LFLTLGCAVTTSDATAQTTISFPYPKWFLSGRDSSPTELVFRMFGYEGMARNLFVLYCKKDVKPPVTVELIPPKGLEHRLRTSASARLRRTRISILDADSRQARFESDGEYDKIAAFIDMKTDEQFFAFLQLFQNDNVLIHWAEANIEYLLEINEVTINQFMTNFRAKVLQAQNEELSYQDVYIRCNTLWKK